MLSPVTSFLLWVLKPIKHQHLYQDNKSLQKAKRFFWKNVLKNKFDQIFTRLSLQPWFPAVSKVITCSAQSSLLCLVWTREIHHNVLVKLGLMFHQHSFVWAYHRSHGGKTLINTVCLITTWCKLLKWERVLLTWPIAKAHFKTWPVLTCSCYLYNYLYVCCILTYFSREVRAFEINLVNLPLRTRARALRPVDAEPDNVEADFIRSARETTQIHILKIQGSHQSLDYCYLREQVLQYCSIADGYLAFHTIKLTSTG